METATEEQATRLHFPDGSSRLSTASPLAGLRAVAASAAFGVTGGDDRGTKSALVVVTEVRAPRRARVRESVVTRLAQCDDREFRKTVKAFCASRDEVACARRIQTLRNVGTRTEGDRRTRREVGVQVVELRSS